MAEHNTDTDKLMMSIDSILNQTYTNFEIVIVDDMTNEKNRKYLQNLQNVNYKINILKNAENMGLAKSLNRAIDFSKGQYIFRMDTDDIALPNRFSEQIKILKRGHSITTARVSLINDDGEYLGETRKIPFYNISKSILLYYLFSNGAIHPLIAAKREVFDEFKYDGNLKFGQDFELWMRMSKKYKIYFHDEILLKYRVPKSPSKEKAIYQYCNHKTVSKKYSKTSFIKNICFHISDEMYKKRVCKKLSITTNELNCRESKLE